MMGETDGIHDALSRIVGNFAREGANADHFATLIEEAFARAEQPLPKVSDLAEKAKRLATVAERLARELRLVCELQSVDLEKERQPGGPVEAGVVTKEGPGSVWPFLRIARAYQEMGCFGEDIPGAMRFAGNTRQARRFDQDIGTPAGLEFQVKRLSEEARLVGSWSKRGAPPNLNRARLEEEIKIIWKELSGQSPGYSRAGTWEKPGTKFGRFLNAILDNSRFGDEERRAIFNDLAMGEQEARNKRRQKPLVGKSRRKK